MSSVIEMNPFHCRMWEMHDRLEALTEETCSREIESVAQYGQIVPALGRPLIADPVYQVELIFGARRLYVARRTNRPILVEVRPMSDLEAIIAMDIENRHRVDVSPYERGRSFARWLRVGYFRSQEDIARGLKISTSQVSRLLKLAHLPSVIVAAFDGPANICEGWGVELMSALEDPSRRPMTLRRARSIATMDPRPGAREVYRQLVACRAKRRRVRGPWRDEVVKSESGVPLFRVRRQRSAVALVIPSGRVTRSVVEAVRGAAFALLTGTTSPRECEAGAGASQAISSEMSGIALTGESVSQCKVIKI